jgi:heat shock protein HtpX
MERFSKDYRRRLNGLSFVLVVALALPPLALGWAVAGPVWGLTFWVLILLLGVLRTRGNEALPGTFALAWHEAPGLFTLVESLARRAGLKRMPEIRIVPGGQTNAAATLRGRLPVLVVTEALLSRLDTRHLGAVLAHETAHLAHQDLVLFRLALTLQASTVVLGALTLALAVVVVADAPELSVAWGGAAALSPLFSRFLVATLSRTREFAADLGAARLTGDPGALADALELIEYRPRTWWDWVTGRRWPVRSEPASDAFRTHPPTPERVRRLDLLTGSFEERTARPSPKPRSFTARPGPRPTSG